MCHGRICHRSRRVGVPHGAWSLRYCRALNNFGPGWQWPWSRTERLKFVRRHTGLTRLRYLPELTQLLTQGWQGQGRPGCVYYQLPLQSGAVLNAARQVCFHNSFSCTVICIFIFAIRGKWCLLLSRDPYHCPMTDSKKKKSLFELVSHVKMEFSISEEVGFKNTANVISFLCVFLHSPSSLIHLVVLKH